MTATGRRVLVAHPGAELYGSDRMLAESVSGLVEAGHRVVVALPGSGPLAGELRARGAEVVTCRMPVLRKAALRPAGLLALVRDALLGLAPAVRLLRAAGRDGVYVSTITIPSWVLLGRLLGRRVTVHVHEAERSAARLVKVVLALPVLAAHAVVVNSRYSRDVLLDSLPRLGRRATVVYNGVAGPRTVTPPRARLDRPVRLAFVGRLSPRKGPQVAVAALAGLVERGVDAHLQLLGSVFPGYEWFEAELRDQVRDAGLQQRVHFAGFVPDVWAPLATADVVLIPSTVDEPFGNTAVEAVLAARPLVVSDTSGLREAGAGYPSAQAVEPGDATAWAEAVQRVVDEWPRYRDQAVADVREAVRRHDPARYRAEIARLVTAPGDAA
ncbi:glycosyltransferase family 4 protein [Blastococcus litoris]|uniref:glycosyltransferase family 4 protein n=1 Tax=Blastococcus litoris TaxID=2171622 RepID=UPI001F147EE0|nr:glycosyltransferase family 4 protein [Blastococcus litoris]